VLSRVRLSPFGTFLYALTIDPSGGDAVDRVIVSGTDGVAVQDISSGGTGSGLPVQLLRRFDGDDPQFAALLSVQTADGLDVYCTARDALRRLSVPLK
jgi:hypothetical protein